jgi:hypothetical protein
MAEHPRQAILGDDTMDIPAILMSQYLASLEMLKQAITLCPDSLWNAQGEKNKPCNLAYHALFFTHFYLADSDQSFTPWSKHPDNYFEEVEWSPAPFDKDTILEYLAFCQNEVRERVPRLDLEAPAQFHQRKRTGLELQIYSIRHIMQHTGELMDRVAGVGKEVDWVGSVHY